MSGSLGNGPLTIRETYNRFCRVSFRVSAVMMAAIGAFCGYGAIDLYRSGESSFFYSSRESSFKVMVLASLMFLCLMVLCFVFSYGLLRMYLELRIDDERIAARAWPFPSTVVPIDQVLKSEVVEINPMWEYGGWGLKGTKRDRLIGGGGTTALRITYTHESGEERKLTFLTDRAEEVDQLIASQLAH